MCRVGHRGCLWQLLLVAWGLTFPDYTPFSETETYFGIGPLSKAGS